MTKKAPCGYCQAYTIAFFVIKGYVRNEESALDWCICIMTGHRADKFTPRLLIA
jgi:hypothetical protein